MNLPVDEHPEIDNPILKEALRLIELGYKVMPCVPGEKRPLTSQGLHDATTDENQVFLWFTDNPKANIAIATGGGFGVFDRDVNKETGKIEPNWPGDEEKQLDLMAGPVAMTPRGGKHYLVGLPQGQKFKNSAGTIAENVDFRGDGGYILVFPSVVDGKPYLWLPGNELDCSIEKLPPAKPWQLDALSGRKPTSVVVTESTSDVIQEGGRNATLTSVGGALRRMGCSEAEILATLLVRNQERCKPPLPEREVRQIAHSVSRYDADQISVLIAEGGNEFDLIPAEPQIECLPSRFIDDIGPGLLRQVIEYNLSGAHVPQPNLAAAGAVALCGAVFGRKVTDDEGTRTNIYCIGLSPSGGGKERARHVNKKILRLADMLHLIPVETVASATAIMSALDVSPSMLLQQDEIGKFLEAIKAAKNSPHMAEIIATFLFLYTSSSETYGGKGYADNTKTKPIHNPNLCLYGTGVPDGVWGSLTSESLTDGLVARILFWETPDYFPNPKRFPSQSDPPSELIETIINWGNYCPGIGNMKGQKGQYPQPRRLFDAPQVNDLFWEKRLQFTDFQRANTPGAGLWSRAYEKARKLALIYECSRNFDATEINRDSAEWGLGLSEHLTRRTIQQAKNQVSDNHSQKSINRIRDALRKSGGSLPLGKITNIFRGSVLAADVIKLLDTLVAAEQVSRKQMPSTGGRSPVIYTLHG
ncbi:MAG: Bifunctional primase/polymerase [Planctomycetaceae bacterium]|nr:Bifunctional primase/polymerase [Planctomycetaceae bacterium]